MSGDAIETMGMIHDVEPGTRDAVHVAVISGVAAHTLRAGQHVGLDENGHISNLAETLQGVVDPYIGPMVAKGQKVWLFLYPRTITGLRHVWEHPDFPDGSAEVAPKQKSSEEWLRAYADEIDEGFGTLIRAAEAYLDSGEYFYGAADEYGMRGKFEGESVNPEFWDHFENYTGRRVPESERGTFFTCSC